MSGNHPTGYEKSDVNVKKIAIATILPAVIIVACLIGLDQYMTFTKEALYYKQVLNVEDVMYKDMVQKETQILNNYKVLDPTKKTVRVPISRAMQLIVQEGQ